MKDRGAIFVRQHEAFIVIYAVFGSRDLDAVFVRQGKVFNEFYAVFGRRHWGRGQSVGNVDTRETCSSQSVCNVEEIHSSVSFES